jgi:protein involved in polysaccharide export with SLBB domain
MTAVSRCVRGLKGIATIAGLVLSIAATAKAQVVAPEEFHVGDRIILTVEGPTSFSDTATVRDGLILRLPNIGDVPLTGVKRADIQTYLTQAIGKFIRDPVVHAQALVRIAVLGAVGRPGFYTLPSDMLLSDVVMSAGGPGGNADLNRTVVKRGSDEILSREQVATALSAGETLDQLHISPGDQMVVGQKPSSTLDTVLRVLSIAVPVASLLFYLSRR